MRKAYTAAQKAEAVALAIVVGAEGAAEQLGMDVRTVRKWAGQAGKGPELAAPAGGWAALLDLAMAKVTSALASGKVRPKDAAVIAGIASRNIREPKPEPDPKTDAETLVDRWLEEVDAIFPDQADLALTALIAGHDEIPLEEYEARFEDPIAYLRSLGDLEEWDTRRKAEREAAYKTQIEANRTAAAAYTTRVLDEETQALVAAAEE